LTELSVLVAGAVKQKKQKIVTIAAIAQLTAYPAACCKIQAASEGKTTAQIQTMSTFTPAGWQQFYSWAIWTEGVIFSKKTQNFVKF